MPDFTEHDRAATIIALSRRLLPDDLRQLIPRDLTRLVATVERRDGLYHPHIADSDLAGFLLDLHGTELLRDREVRRLLVEQSADQELQELFRYTGDLLPTHGRGSIEERVVNRSWHAGKSWPRHFVRTLGLPLAMAGTPDGGEAPAFEDVEPYVRLPDLHPFQRCLLQEVLGILHSPPGCNRAILSLPTGAGKTRTMVEAIVQGLMGGSLSGRFVLWLAQSEELCEQAIQSFRQVWADRCVQAALPGHRGLGPLRLFRLWSSRAAPDPSETGIVVAGIQKLDALCRAGDNSLSMFFEAVGVIVVDEAHHAIAPSYSAVFRTLGAGNPKQGSERPMVGLTATPYRGSDEETNRLIRRFYGRLLTPDWADPIARLREDEILARASTSSVPTGRRFNLDVREQEHLKTFHELPDSALRRIGSDRDRNGLILEQLLRLPADWPVLFFACSVTHARAIALLLRRAGRSAAAITGDTPQSLRRAWINDFREGALQFLCNFGVLTTGFDAPKVRVVVVARPTRSVLLYEQMIGRGMRGPANGGKEECLVIDMVDIIPQFGEQMSYQRYAGLWARSPARPGVVPTGA